jgi:hypothetical protein
LKIIYSYTVKNTSSILAYGRSPEGIYMGSFIPIEGKGIICTPLRARTETVLAPASNAVEILTSVSLDTKRNPITCCCGYEELTYVSCLNFCHRRRCRLLDYVRKVWRRPQSLASMKVSWHCSLSHYLESTGQQVPERRDRHPAAIAGGLHGNLPFQGRL